jgi:hypothetical protein
VLLKAGMPGALQLSVGENVSDMRQVLWNMRQLDMFGQIILIVAGALGVVVLFTENKNGGK